jgi:hypothetical protein
MSKPPNPRPAVREPSSFDIRSIPKKPPAPSLDRRRTALPAQPTDPHARPSLWFRARRLRNFREGD